MARKKATIGDYERRKEAARAKAADESKTGRDIGNIPPVADSARRAAANRSFQTFCEVYFPQRFPLAWSPDHLRVIGKIELATITGGLFAMAMPRGAGKTTLCECAVLWSVLTGRHSFTFLIGSCEGQALSMLANIKAELMHNDLLFDDYPEAIAPIKALENQTRRCVGQLHHGEPTFIQWGADQIVMPSIPGSRASSAIIRVAGLTGNIRGAVATRPDGMRVRPTLVVLDDPQTDQSARSLSQCAHRESILAGAVLGMAGPGKKIAGIMPCTVIAQDDMADRILDREKHPQWQGERTKMVYSFPINQALWDRYAEIRGDSLRNDGDGSEATDFYRDNRAEMDAGADVSWEARFNPDELSAIQHAMNLKLRDEAAFFAEYQNEPIVEDVSGDVLKADQIANRINRIERGKVPDGCTRITAMIDIQKRVLYYLVAAWEDNFTGYVIDYGTWPDQKRLYYHLADIRHTLQAQKPDAGMEGAIYHGLDQLTNLIMTKAFIADSGEEMHIDQCLIDANWGESTDVVYQFCRQSAHAANILPTHGRFVGASSIPFSEYRRKRGDRVGPHWRMPSVVGKRQVRHVLVDTNYWKSFIHARLAVAIGDPGSLTLYGDKPINHMLLAEHLTAEFRVQPSAPSGRVVDVWKTPPNQPDNHWFDCLVGCAVAASMTGSALPGVGGSDTERRGKRLKLSDIQRRKPV